MSKVIVQSLEGNIMHAFSLVNQYMDTCPDAVWNKKFGGWPVWQQLYHPFTAIDFFLRDENAPAAEGPLPDAIGNLQESPAQAPTKEVIRNFITEAQKAATQYIATLDDAALADKNPGLSARIGREMTNAGTLALLASHTMYHLGCCDAALRENGLPGVF